MKKIYLFALAAITAFASQAQISQGGVPLSFHSAIAPLETEVMLEKPEGIEDLIEGRKNGESYHFAKMMFTDLSIQNSGQWDELENGIKIWRLQISSEGAKSLLLYFNEFHLPEDGKLFIYSEDKKQLIGAFTSFNNHKSRLFATEMIHGSSLVLEYTHIDSELPLLSIDKVGYAYRDINGGGAFGSSEYCQVNTNCSEADDWQDQSNSACRLVIPSGGGFIGFCSGAAINNTDEDCAPYILSADHCFDGDDFTTSILNQTVFHFNYEASSCANPNNEPSSNTMTGGSHKANSGGEGDNGDSDFFLLELNNTIPANYGVFMSGWDRNNTGATSGVSIHHPSGDIKKISTFTSTLNSAGGLGWGNNNTTHWRVYWSETENGHGVTEGGSSGSPIFNQNGHIVGKLTGGSSYCNATNSPDVYGKIWSSWDQMGNSNSRRLKPWLAPSSTNTTVLDGKFCGTNLDASFTANTTTVATGSCVTFTDNSSGDPTNLSWTFLGGTPASATGAGPHTICYNNEGNYTVILNVSDAEGNNDNLTEVAYITVDSDHVSIEETEFANNVLIYPNPTAGNINVTVLDNNQANTIKVIDILGKAVFETTTTELNTKISLQENPAGIYFVEITNGQTKAVKKIILSR